MITQVIDIAELNEISEYLQDEELTKVLAKVVELYAKPELENQQKVVKAIVKLEAFAQIAKLKGKYYMYLGKDEPNAREKKNLYLSVSESLSAIVQSLKYGAKL